MHVRLPQSLISMSAKTIYKSVVFGAIDEVFATGCFTFNYRQRYQEKTTLYLPRATGSRSSSLYLSFSNTNYL